MKITNLPIEGLKLVELKIFRDHRGFFVERYNEDSFKRQGLDIHFVQDNHSLSGPGVVRGLHYQYAPAQSKLVGCIRGRVWDVAVDLRPASPTFGQHYGIELSGENGLLLWVPAGFAHGFCVMGDEPADVTYKVNALYSPQGETGVKWNDPDLKIQWPVKTPVVSPRDEQLLSFQEFKAQAGKFAPR